MIIDFAKNEMKRLLDNLKILYYLFFDDFSFVNYLNYYYFYI